MAVVAIRSLDAPEIIYFAFTGETRYPKMGEVYCFRGLDGHWYGPHRWVDGGKPALPPSDYRIYTGQVIGGSDAQNATTEGDAQRASGGDSSFAPGVG